MLCPYCNSRPIQKTCRGNNEPKTCGYTPCVQAHKKRCRKTWDKKHPVLIAEYRKQEYEKRKALNEPKRMAIAVERERKLNADALRLAVFRLKREAMFRDGIVVCGTCGKYFKRGEIRLPYGKEDKSLSGCCKACTNKQRKKTMWNNPDTYRKIRKKHYAMVKADPVKLLTHRIRQRTSKALIYANVKKQRGCSSMRYIGCTRYELRNYMEMQFKSGMTWDNYGRKKGIKTWVVDHVIPIASFNLSDENERHKAFHYTNLAPLWIKENEKKNDRMPTIPHQPRLMLA